MLGIARGLGRKLFRISEFGGAIRRATNKLAATVGAVALVVLGAAGPLHAAEDGAAADGSLAWFDSDRLDLIGAFGAEVPLAQAGVWRVFASAWAQTAIEKTTTDITFLVDQVSYRAFVGARRPVGSAGSIEVFAGESGLVLVDRPGRARIRLAGVAWQTQGFRRAFGPPGFSARASVAGVVGDHGISASADVEGSVRYLHELGSSRRVAIGADASVEALFGDDDGVDIAVGPRLEVDLTGDRRFGVFVRWIDAEHPLGLNTQGVAGGFDFAQGLGAGGSRVTPPEISGLWAAGGGDGGRGFVRLDLRIVTPPFLYGTTAQAEVNGSVLSASDLNDLFYEYDVGFSHEAFEAWRAGVYFHHRSNHVINADNPEVTSINVLEAGLDSDGWNRAEPGGVEGRAGALDARVRAGWLIDSAFGEDDGWHARAGLRWASPELGPARIYLSAELERGDVGRSEYAAGTLLPRGWDVRLSVVHDEQLFSEDRRAALAVATLRY